MKVSLEFSELVEHVFKGLAFTIHSTAFEHGFWKDRQEVISALGDKGILFAKAQMIALMHSELSELLEELRQPEVDEGHETEELADVIIRIFDYAEGFRLPLASTLLRKIEANSARPHKHGKLF